MGSGDSTRQIVAIESTHHVQRGMISWVQVSSNYRLGHCEFILFVLTTTILIMLLFGYVVGYICDGLGGPN